MGSNQVGDIPGVHHTQVSVPPHLLGDVTVSHHVFRAPFKCAIRKLSIIPGAAISGAATHTFHLNVVNRGTNGLGTTEIANRDYVSGTDEAAHVKRDIYAPATPLEVAEATQIDLVRELIGNGIASPPLLVDVEYEAR